MLVSAWIHLFADRAARQPEQDLIDCRKVKLGAASKNISNGAGCGGGEKLKELKLIEKFTKASPRPPAVRVKA